MPTRRPPVTTTTSNQANVKSSAVAPVVEPPKPIVVDKKPEKKLSPVKPTAADEKILTLNTDQPPSEDGDEFTPPPALEFEVQAGLAELKLSTPESVSDAKIVNGVSDFSIFRHDLGKVPCFNFLSKAFHSMLHDSMSHEAIQLIYMTRTYPP